MSQFLWDDDVAFDEERHEYRARGMVLPSVTQILKPWSPISKIPEARLEAAREFGTIVHAATALDDQNDLDELSVDAEVLAYVRGWRKFRQDWDFLPRMIERRFADVIYQYAGTPDRFGLCSRPGEKAVRHATIDIKTGVSDPTHGPQAAAYHRATAEELAAEARKRAITLTVYLKPDDYAVTEHNPTQDWGTFMAALTWHRWRESFNL